MEDDNKKKSEDAIVKSSKYLKRQLLSGDADNDRYALSIISYALMLLDDDDAPYVFERRNKLKGKNESLLIIMLKYFVIQNKLSFSTNLLL